VPFYVLLKARTLWHGHCCPDDYGRYQMTWFANLQLLWKILSVTLMVCAVTVGVGVVGYRGLQQTTADVDGFGRVLVLKVADTARMHQPMYEAVSDLRGAMLATDPADVQPFLEGSTAAMGETDAAFTAYQALPLSTDEKKMLSDYDTAHKAWEAAMKESMAAVVALPPLAAVDAAAPAEPAVPAVPDVP